MGVVLDFGTTVLDGTTVLPVAFSANGESAVLPLVARSDTLGTGRPAPNPLHLYSDRIRVGTSEAACLSATWGAGLADIGTITAGGVRLYMQFRRLEADGTSAVSLADAVGLVSSGFVAMENTASGVSVSLGTASASAIIAPDVASSRGKSVSLGVAIAAQLAASVGHGKAVSHGSAAGSKAAAPVEPLVGTRYLHSTEIGGTGVYALTETQSAFLRQYSKDYEEGQSGRFAVLNSNFSVASYVTDPFEVNNGYENGYRTISGISFAAPTVGPTQYFGLLIGAGKWVLPQGVSPQAQSGLQVVVFNVSDEDYFVSAVQFGTSDANSRVIFAGS